MKGKKDFIDDPYFSQMDKFAQEHGLEKTREVHGATVMSWYARLKIASESVDEPNNQENHHCKDRTQYPRLGQRELTGIKGFRAPDTLKIILPKLGGSGQDESRSI